MFTFQIKVLKSQDPFSGVSFAFFLIVSGISTEEHFSILEKNAKRVVMCPQVPTDLLTTITHLCIFGLLRDNSRKLSFYLFIAIMTSV